MLFCAVAISLWATGSAFIVSVEPHRPICVLKAKASRKKDVPEQDPAKRAALDGVLNQIERSYGRGSIVKLGDAESMKVACIGSGSLTLDAAIGGGYPKGRCVNEFVCVAPFHSHLDDSLQCR